MVLDSVTGTIDMFLFPYHWEMFWICGDEKDKLSSVAIGVKAKTMEAQRFDRVDKMFS